ncbi:MAG: transcription elongation factor GreA [Gammaproteobacteria bacterium]|nr:transcription elongation factor GreA [Gammaproteobacteria bacterium]NIM73925.1 transcription elongation factor GreA [Gammaproteobacteria bacterium]NIN38113.1 transcription elongation factor GreA [Gammaproteobacteria bacterium]NIO25706.1 transcription elongation factor GreA [Gammaproteobacteria bacterium]NIO66340.1 transcription elongation factor GreA [Gammaproteobacteria bacterium]
MSRVPITTKGAQKLRDELQRLKTVERPRIISAIAEARAHGDLRENAEYHAAKEEQSFTEGRIAAIEQCLGNAELIDISRLNAQDRVVFGATVELFDVDADKQVTYQIVGEMEADIGGGLISISSPIARALIGKSEGDQVTVNAPGGARDYEIISVKYV